MSILNIQNALITRLKGVLEDFPLKLSSNDDTPFKIFPHKLPEELLELFNFDDQKTHKSVYPFVVVQVDNGSKENMTAMGSHVFKIGVGVKNEGLEGQGYDDVIVCITEILNDLYQKPILENFYKLEYPVNWKLDYGNGTDEDHPFYHGVISVNILGNTMQYVGGNGSGERAY